MIKTKWYPISVKPARNGVYETQTDIEATSEDGCGGPWFNWWDGSQWATTGNSPDEANKNAATKYRIETVVKIFRWRGLTEKAA